MCFNPKFCWDIHFSALDHWAIYNPWYLAKISKYFYLSNMNIDGTI